MLCVRASLLETWSFLFTSMKNNYTVTCKQRLKYRSTGRASLLSIYTEQAIVAQELASLFPVKCPWNTVFYISIKVLSLRSTSFEHSHYHHGSQQSNYAHSQHHHHPPPNPMLRPRCFTLDLGKLTSASLQPMSEQR